MKGSLLFPKNVSQRTWMKKRNCKTTTVHLSGFSAGSASSRGGVDANLGSDGEECQHEWTAGQRQRLSDRLPTEGEGKAAWNNAEGPGVNTGRLSEGMWPTCDGEVKKLAWFHKVHCAMSCLPGNSWMLRLNTWTCLSNLFFWNIQPFQRIVKMFLCK